MAIAILFIGIYVWYNTSKRAELRDSSITTIVASNRVLSRIIAGSSLMISLLIFVFNYGAAVGFFYFISVLMCVTGMLILLSPFRLFKNS